MRRRGFVSRAMLLVVAGLTSVILIGLSARRADLRSEDRTRCRAAARWAAESAVNRGLARMDHGVSPSVSGSLDGAKYRVEGRAGVLDGWGECTSQGRTVKAHVHVEAERAGGRWQIARFRELPVAPAAP